MSTPRDFIKNQIAVIMMNLSSHKGTTNLALNQIIPLKYNHFSSFVRVASLYH